MKLTVYDMQGKEVDSIDADDLVFGLPPHKAALRQALLLGRSRQGAIRAPHHRHGGISFGPKPRSFKQALPKRVRRLAIRSALSAKAEDGELRVIRGLELDSPKTKAIAEMLERLEITRTALLVTAETDRNILMSSRNLKGAKALPADYLNVADLLSHHGLIMTVEAVRRAEALWGGERANKRRAPLPEAARG